MKKYDNLALLIHPMYSIITDIYRNTTGLGKITFKEMEPEYVKRLNAYKESVSLFKKTNTLFVIVEPTKDLINFKLDFYYKHMMEELYSFAKKEMPFSFKVIKDTNYISELKKITPLLKKSVGIFPFGEHRNVCVKTYNEFTLDFFKKNNLRPKNKGIQTKFSFDIENKRERKRPKVFLKIKK
jgi:hypothetical protein